MAIHTMEPWATKAQLDTLMQPVGECVFAVKDVTATAVTLKWQDPDDTRIGDQFNGFFTFARWARTVIVKRLNADPESATDGTLVVESVVRDRYKTEGYVDEQADGSDWHYAAFSFAENGKVTRTLFRENYLFGYFVDETDPDEETCVHYLAANADYGRMYWDFENDRLVWGGWENAWILPRPCMLRHDGTVAYYLNPDNYLQKEDGTPSDVADSGFDGEAMLEWPRIFLKSYRDETTRRLYVLMSDKQLDDGYECWPCKKADGTYADHYYTAIYEGSMISNKLRSISTGLPPNQSTGASTTQAVELANAQALGAGWATTTWADEMYIRAITILLIGRLNSQAAFGSAYKSGATQLVIPCGSLNDKGMFFGSYFDGTSNNTTGCKFLGMEQPWGHRHRRPIGLVVDNGQYKVKMTRSTIDGSSVDRWEVSDQSSTYAGYLSTGVNIPTNWGASYITSMAAGNCLLLPIAAGGGSSTTGYCDDAWSATGLRCALLGGALAYGSQAGVSFCGVNNAPSSSWWHTGASLSYHHL